MAGVLAGAGIMVLVFGFDVLFFRPLATPDFLSGALHRDDVDGSAPVVLRTARIAIFTILHLFVFTLLGIVLARILSLTGLRKSLLAGGAYGLIVCTIVFAASLQVSGTHLTSEVGWAAVLGANVTAGVIMVVFLRIVQGVSTG